MSRRKSFFSLIEVVVAVGVLGLGLVAFLTLANSSQQRLIKAKERWMNFHMLTQGAEFYLLQSSEENIGDLDYEVFDYPGYKIICTYVEPEELPEEFTGISENQAPLRGCVIELARTSDDKILDSITVERIMYNNETD